MAADYAVEGNSLNFDKPHLWSPAQVRPLSQRQDYDLHPDGNRLVAAGLQENAVGAGPDHVSMILNFTNELRRIASDSRR
jgi:hypothetical protein